jgi:3-deoxy-D-arabino-heptulosonate 7-phosphate (DAHP) synthase class II
MAQAIYQAGYLNVRQVAEANVENLQKIPGYDVAETAQKLKETAAAVVEKAGDLLTVGAAADDSKGSFTATPSNNAKSMAEERLREMMKEAGKTDKKDEESK